MTIFNHGDNAPEAGKGSFAGQFLAISRATTKRWMSLVPSVHNRISISTAPFVQQPGPTSAGPTEIFLRQPAGTTVINFYKQNVYDPSDIKIGGVDDILIDKEYRVTTAIIGVGGFLGMGERTWLFPSAQSAPARRTTNGNWFSTRTKRL